MPPPRETNRAYYAEALPASMKAEAGHFFYDLLSNNGSVARFIDSDYTFVDKKLAKLYDLPEQKSLRLADGFHRVELRSNSHRGGLLGMAAVLTVSANGIETSPVTRGVWVSENILGIQPPQDTKRRAGAPNSHYRMHFERYLSLAISLELNELEDFTPVGCLAG